MIRFYQISLLIFFDTVSYFILGYALIQIPDLVFSMHDIWMRTFFQSTRKHRTSRESRWNAYQLKSSNEKKVCILNMK